VQERVRAAVAKLGYVPSLAARRLGGSRSYLILALNDMKPTIEGWQARRGNDWVDQMLLGGMLKCAEYGYRMLFELVDSHADAIEGQVQAALSSLHPDGVILTPPHSENATIIDLLQRNGVPFARVGSRGNGTGVSIYMDDAEAARIATNHLLDLGHREIAFLKGSPDYAVSAERLEGYRQAMSARGVEVHESLIQNGDFSYDSGAAAMEKLLGGDEPFTAVVASSDEMALAALHVAGRNGLSVPHDLSLVSFDDTPVVRLSMPPLTAVCQPIAPMTAKAAELLIEGSQSKGHDQSTHVFPFEFVVRESTAPVR
jgi:LacI family transcriptional regulator